MTNRPEPAAIIAAVKELISSVIKLLVVFAIIQMTTEQFGILMIVVDSAMAVIATLLIRNAVTPIEKPAVPEGTVVSTYNADGEVTREVEV